MLAQKIALETDELGALKIARSFSPNEGAKVSYEEKENRGKIALKILESASERRRS
jgi:hypothetical protein